MRTIKTRLLLCVGVGLIVCSAALMLVTTLRDQAGEKQCRQVTAQLQTLLPAPTAGVTGQYPSSAMPTLEINGTDYVALVSLPRLGIALPVANEWNNHRLHTSPRRFYGTVEDGSLVIGGSDRAEQFAFCSTVEHGETVIVTDMTGAQFFYTVTRIDRANHAETAWLTNPDADLTLFCRERNSLAYLAVRCTAQ